MVWRRYDINNNVVSEDTTLIFSGTILSASPNIGISDLGGQGAPYVKFTHDSPSYTLDPGDYVTIRYIKRFSSGSNIIHNTLVLGYNWLPYEVSLNEYFGDMTCKDFLVSLISMHNLYIEPDRNNDKNVIIEPFINYYKLNNDAKDWTSKVDTLKNIEMEPLSPNLAKNYIYTHLEDGDFLNRDYKENNQFLYGEYRVTQEGDFNTNTITTSTKFAQTPLLDRSDDNSILIMPTIVKDASNNKIDGFKPRVFYWTGVRFVAPSSGDFGSFRIDGQSTKVVGSATSSNPNGFRLDMYGYAGHFDNPTNASLDLNFGINSRYYYGDGYQFYVTENTLFDKYYQSYYDEITDPNTRILKCFMELTSYDISTLSFRRLYYINNNLYRLQLISDYDPISRETTYCEFLKVKNAPTNEINRKNFYTRPRPIYTTNKIPDTLKTDVISVGVNLDVDTNLSPTGVMIGKGMTVSVGVEKYLLGGENIYVGTASTNINVFGRDIIVGTSSENINAYGNNIQVGDFVTNSVIIGNNVYATESNSIYLGSEKIFIDGEIFITGTLSGSFSIPIGLQDVLDYDNIDDDTQFSIEPDNNIILGRTNSSITGFGTDNIIFGNNNDIINSTGAFAGGFDNIINFSNATFVYGYQNTATNSVYSGVFGQLNESIGPWNFISGQSNKGYFSTAGFISGIGNYITQSFQGAILGGIDNGIQNATSSVIIGGHNHLIDDFFVV